MFNLRFAFDYFLHQINAKTRHGIHSPFVYRLADEVLYDDSEKKVYAEIEQLRDVLYADDRLINITDLGAGSSINKNNKKRISDIAKNSLKKPKLAQLLYRLVVNQKPKNMIELGTCLGITSMYLQNAAPEAKLFTLEGCIEIAEVAQNVFSKAGRNDIELVIGNFVPNLNVQRRDKSSAEVKTEIKQEPGSNQRQSNSFQRGGGAAGRGRGANRPGNYTKCAIDFDLVTFACCVGLGHKPDLAKKNSLSEKIASFFKWSKLTPQKNLADKLEMHKYKNSFS